jgi:hypothetical protein
LLATVLAWAGACTSFSGSGDSTPPDTNEGGTDAPAPPPPAADSGADVVSPKCGDPLATPSKFAFPATPPDSIATDGAFLYWTSNAGKQLGRAPLAGGAAIETLLTGATASLSRLTFTSDDILWKNADHLYWAPKTDVVDGGLPDGSASYLTDSVGDVVALGAEIVYVRGGDGMYHGTPGEAFGSLLGPSTARALSGLGPRVVFIAPDVDAGSSSIFSIDDVHKVIGKPRFVAHDDGGAPAVLAADGQSIFYATDAADAVYSVPVAGGEPQIVANGQSGISAIVLDGDDLFFASTSGIARVAKTGGCIEPITGLAASSFVIIAPWLYAIQAASIVRVPR